MSQPHGTILRASDFKVQGKKVYIKLSVSKGIPGMLLIWGDFCGHCHRLMPTFNEIADKIGNKFGCVSIESEELKGQDVLTTALDFRGYPTICFYNQNGMIMSQYDGKRDKLSILDSICKTYHQCYK